MNYKYKRNQIFGKRLKVPKYILNKIYSCSLSVFEYFENDLVDKIPLECLTERYRLVLERFGIEKSKTLDWELIDRVDLYDTLMSIDPKSDNINEILYDDCKDRIKIYQYTDGMKKYLVDRFVDIPEDMDKDSEEYYLYSKFNSDDLSISDIFKHWDLLKDKDLSYYFLNGHEYNFDYNEKITQEQVRTFMDKYKDLIKYFNVKDIYQLIISDEDKRNELLKEILSNILKNEYVEVDNSFYKIYFKYFSLEDILKEKNEYIDDLLEELKILPKDYIFNCGIPFNILLNYDVLCFINRFGLKNVVDFDNECGHFFTKDNCNMLFLMFDMYMHYAGNEWDSEKDIYDHHYVSCRENGDHPFTKDEFYESMRRMIIYGPSDWNYASKAPNYMSMTGEFKNRNKTLFIDDEAPDELKELFYTKKLTPYVMMEHPEYREYLKGRDLESCFENRQLELKNSDNRRYYFNLYKYLLRDNSFDDVMDFICSYGDIIEEVHLKEWKCSFSYSGEEKDTSTLEDIKDMYVNRLLRLIIEKNIEYPNIIPDEVVNKYPKYFISNKAPLELINIFKKREFKYSILKEHPEYEEYIKDLDLEVLFKSIPMYVKNDGYYGRNENFVKYIKDKYDNPVDIITSYIDIIDNIYNIDKNINLDIDDKTSKEEFINKLDDLIYKYIIDGKIKYDDSLPLSFKNKHKDMFLYSNIDINIRNKFYNREFKIEDFSDEKILSLFKNTNIICGMDLSYSWMINTFKEENNIEKANLNRLLLLGEYLKIDDLLLKEAFKDYVCSCEVIDVNKIEYISSVLKELAVTNSFDMYSMRKQLATEILKCDNPLSALRRIENVFIKNNLPTVGKIYSAFEILHPGLAGFDFKSEKMCPSLKRKSLMSKRVILFSDLLKSYFGSNNKNLKEYLEIIKVGNSLFEQLKREEIKYEDLDDTSKFVLNKFRGYVCTLFNNSLRGKGENNCYTLTDDVYGDLLILAKKLSIDESIDYDLGDRVIKMFCFYSGFDTIDQALDYMNGKVKNAEARNKAASKVDMKLEVGDFVKGINDIKYLRNILQNGSVSKEFLGPSVDSDLTPLDTDLSMILGGEDNDSMLSSLAANGYGSIWLVLKHDDRFCVTRKHDGSEPEKYNKNKLEAFYTGVCGTNHYGIRTGFASSEINYIMVREYDPRIGLEIAMNGFYIPVCNVEGKLVFSEEDYNNLRDKMKGLDYYKGNRYQISYDLNNPMVEEVKEELGNAIGQNQDNLKYLFGKISEVLNGYGIPRVSNGFSGDLSNGLAEIYSTGSTARNAFVPGDNDYDYVIKVDRNDYNHIDKLKSAFKSMGLSDGPGGKVVGNVMNPNGEELEVEISFQCKTDKNDYSTNSSLEEYYNSIRKIYPDSYLDVLANIVLAKKLFKEAHVYKSAKSDNSQGGLGGIGIENWILQHGGSFKEAATDFMKVSMECGYDFDKFKDVYQVWDFGNNHYEGGYPHDNFVYQNDNGVLKKMTPEGYKKMLDVLSKYLNIELVEDKDKTL